MYVYKSIPRSAINVDEVELHKSTTLTTSSLYLTSSKFQSGSTLNDGLTPDGPGSYWQSLRFNFYMSGSALSVSESKFNLPTYSLLDNNYDKPQHRNKFYKSGSVISISQKYFGDYIKPGSFTLTDLQSKSTIASTNGVNPIIKDDSYGNLYSTNAFLSQSAGSHASSSENYVGNIMYDLGIITLTETGSWSGSIPYSGMALPGTDYRIEFESSVRTWVKEYSIEVKPNEFNYTNNPSARGTLSGSSTEKSGAYLTASLSSMLRSNLTASNWTPAMTTIGLYDLNNQLLAIAKYPQPIKMRKDMTLVFKIRQDW